MILALCLLCGLALSSLYLLLLAFTPRPRRRLASETNFRSCQSSELQPLPSLHEDAQVDLTLVVPAYNESKRLPGMLRESIAYLQDRGASFEVLVVDDGSTDHGRTVEAALAVAEELKGKGGEHVRVVTLAHNRGKGGAVTHVSAYMLHI
jgi:dolichyl-phosphate beta-glucosyltransferase